MEHPDDRAWRKKIGEGFDRRITDLSNQIDRMSTPEGLMAKYGLALDMEAPDWESKFLQEMQEEILEGDPLRAIEMLDFDMQSCYQVPAVNWTMRGLANFVLGRWSNAIDDTSKALRIDPGFAPAYAIQAEAYLRKGDAANALNAADRALIFHPDYPWALGVRASACYLLRYLDSAIDAADRALETEPKWFLPREARALSYYQLGRLDEAVSDAHVLSAADPDNVVARRILRCATFGFKIFEDIEP